MPTFTIDPYKSFPVLLTGTGRTLCPSSLPGICPDGPQQSRVESHSAATQEGSSKVRDKGTAGLILWLMWHKVPSAQRAPANERAAPSANKPGKVLFSKQMYCTSMEILFPPKKF